MQRVLKTLIALVFFVSVTEAAQAWFWNKPKEEKPAPAAEPARQETVQPAPKAKMPAQKAAPSSKAQEKNKADAEKKTQEARKAKRELVEKKRREIDNMEWTIQLSPLSGKGKKIADTVVFQDGMVAFKEFGKKDFPATNFSLKIQEDNVAVWETMQTSEKAGVAFWRGEISPDMQTMRGVLSHRISDKIKEDYSFVSTAVSRGVGTEEKK